MVKCSEANVVDISMNGARAYKVMTTNDMWESCDLFDGRHDCNLQNPHRLREDVAHGDRYDGDALNPLKLSIDCYSGDGIDRNVQVTCTYLRTTPGMKLISHNT